MPCSSVPRFHSRIIIMSLTPRAPDHTPAACRPSSLKREFLINIAKAEALFLVACT